MERQALKTEVRLQTGKGQNKRLRREGKVPGVVYGKQGKVIHLQLNRTELLQAINTSAGYNILLDLDIPGAEKETVMIKDLTRDVLKKDIFTHIDFIRVSLKDKLEVDIPLEIMGEPIGVKEGGIPQMQTREITILTLPTDIPESIKVDVSDLNVGDTLMVKDIEFAEGIEVITEPDEVIFSVLAPTLLEEEEELEEGEEEMAEDAEAEESEEESDE